MPFHSCRPMAVLLLLLTTSVAGGADIDTDALDRIVRDSLKSWDVPGASVVVVRDGKVIHLQGYGVRDVEIGKPVTPDTVFAIASCSKAFTATAIASLVDERKMSWDDPVRKHVSFFRLQDPLADANVTIRDLLCHRTGLVRHDLLGHGAPWDRAEILRRLAHVKPTYGFRTTFQYQNLMFVAAGYAAGQADGSTWEASVQKRLLDPLEMKATNFSIKDVAKTPDHAMPHIIENGKRRRIDLHNIDNMGPAGSMNSTVRDLAAWLRFQLGDGTVNGKRVVSTANLEETHTPQMLIRLEGVEKDYNPESIQKSYGLGWFIQDYRGRPMLSHTGGLDGFRCRIVLLPRERLGIALLSNSSVGISRASMPIACTTTLVDHLLGLPKKDWDRYYGDLAKAAEARRVAFEKRREVGRQKGTRPSRERAAYVGEYEEPAYGRARITLDGDILKLSWSSFNDSLEHFHFDTFRIKARDFLEGEELVFHLDGEGNVTTFDFLGVTFKRVK